MKHSGLFIILFLAFLAIGKNAAATNVVDIISASESHETLEAAVVAAGLAETLQGEGPFTVFAPTDEAFAALPEGTLEALLADPSGDLTNILLFHVAGAKVMSSELSNGQLIETVLGKNVVVSITEGKVFINGAEVTVADIEADNGVVHVIDAVLIPDMRPATVVDIALGNDDFSILVAALTREDLTTDFVGALSGEGPFTVFAPTNDAFAALLEELGASSLNDIDAATLEAVLQMHVIAAKVMSSDLSEGMTAETLLGQELTFSLEDGAAITDPNGRISNITAVDVEAQNGVVHVIDKVILSDMRPATVVDIALGSDDFSILVAALTRDDLSIDFVGALSGEGPFTVFAPTNDAFVALLDELGASSLDDIDAATLESVLQMHVIPARVMSTDLSEGLTAATLLGQELTFSLEGGASITDPNGRMSNITAVDVDAQNGVVHVIDKVILPDMRPATVVDIALGSDDFSILVAALTRDDLTIDFVGALSGEGPFTVFAPTNDAFVALLDELGVSSLDDIATETLEAVLQMHVVAGAVKSTDLSEGLAASTLLGQEITFSLEDGAAITDPNGRTSNITAVDIEAQNGVVHVIDRVILPDLSATNAFIAAGIKAEFYPNPAKGFINVVTDSPGARLSINDISGRTVLSERLNYSNQRIDISKVNAGIYFITIQDGSSRATQKLVVR